MKNKKRRATKIIRNLERKLKLASHLSFKINFYENIINISVNLTFSSQ